MCYVNEKNIFGSSYCVFLGGGLGLVVVQGDLNTLKLSLCCACLSLLALLSYSALPAHSLSLILYSPLRCLFPLKSFLFALLLLMHNFSYLFSGLFFFLSLFPGCFIPPAVFCLSHSFIISQYILITTITYSNDLMWLVYGLLPFPVIAVGIMCNKKSIKVVCC